jgi:hypothetical protein
LLQIQTFTILDIYYSIMDGILCTSTGLRSASTRILFILFGKNERDGWLEYSHRVERS